MRTNVVIVLVMVIMMLCRQKSSGFRVGCVVCVRVCACLCRSNSSKLEKMHNQRVQNVAIITTTTTGSCGFRVSSSSSNNRNFLHVLIMSKIVFLRVRTTSNLQNLIFCSQKHTKAHETHIFESLKWFELVKTFF